MDISTEQLHALDDGQPVSLNVEGRPCVLVPSPLYEQLFDDWHPRVMQRQVARMMADDWNDPAMSVYDV
jgi:hypothetical protein